LLLPREHILCLVPQFPDNLIPRLRKPRNAMSDASIFLFVSPFATPIKDRDATLLPVLHRIPVASLIRTQVLIRAITRIPPKLRNLVVSGINPRSDALPFRIAYPQQQQVPGWSKMLYQRPHSLHRIRRHQTLLGEDVFQLLVVLIRESEI